MAPSLRSQSGTLKQAKLSFGATKRTSSANSIKGVKAKSSPATTPKAPITPVTLKRTLSSEAEDVESVSEDERRSDAELKAAKDVSSDVDLSTVATSDLDEVPLESPPTKRRRTAALPKPTNKPPAKPKTIKVDGRSVQAVPALDDTKEEGIVRERLNTKDKKYRSHYVTVRNKMGNLEPVHGEGQTMVHHILRVFDLSYEYGPCIGVTRLQRWERAKAMGLDPPLEVYDILMTQEGTDKPEFSQCVFYDEV